jgi:hypothetical protein
MSSPVAKAGSTKPRIPPSRLPGRRRAGGTAAPSRSGGDLDPAFAALLRALAGDAQLGGAVEALLAGKAAGVPRRFGSNALRVKGRIFAMWVRGRLVLKLPRVRVAELTAAGRATHFDANKGIAMKEWAAIAGEALRTRAARSAALELVREAYAFVGSA